LLTDVARGGNPSRHFKNRIEAIDHSRTRAKSGGDVTNKGLIIECSCDLLSEPGTWTGSKTRLRDVTIETAKLTQKDSQLTTLQWQVSKRMGLVSVDSIDYRILCDGKAIITSWTNSITTVLPRNFVSFNGPRFSVTDLRATVSIPVVKIILILIRCILCPFCVKLTPASWNIWSSSLEARYSRSLIKPFLIQG
jgi:hypothetical protein